MRVGLGWSNGEVIPLFCSSYEYGCGELLDFLLFKNHLTYSGQLLHEFTLKPILQPALLLYISYVADNEDFGDHSLNSHDLNT